MTIEIFFNALESLAETLYPAEIEKVDALISNIIDHMNWMPSDY